MSQLIIIRGLPGSSKSTLAKSFGIFHVEADMFFMKDLQYKWYRTGANHKWCEEMVENAMSIGMDVVVSNTFTTHKEFKKYLELAEEYNYDVRVIRCVAEFGNTHSVPEETLTAMRNRFQDYEGEEIYDASNIEI